ncbi:MAG: 50S ribosomal protein L5 [Verrucomicrobia bacterium]|nr:50S ribosomal protein L5 [Verrucomicrobiota bacterium]MDA1085735.1 50S ribosomal protein L5 [Verrucomicrobiota bacterium]
MATLQEKYVTEIRPAVMKARGHVNLLQAPRITKVVVNMGIGAAVDKEVFKALTEDLATISGQRPEVTKARKSISNFKLREGMDIGARVTLRGKRMWEFLDRLINSALPRVRDFRGISAKGFDGRGNFSLGIRDQVIFPEIDPDKIKLTHGMDITIVTTGSSDDDTRELLKLIGMPFATSE